MSRPSSGRWYWCVGCGKWHDPLKKERDGFHFLMYCDMQDPDAGNFEGTGEELARFLAYRKLKEEESDLLEVLIDKRVTRPQGEGFDV